MSSSQLTSTFYDLLLFAQDGAGGAPAGGGAGAPDAGAGGLLPMLPMISVFVVMFYLMVMRPQQKEQAQRKALLDELKKNDKVLTIGGIIGTVVDFSSDRKRVTLRVDDGTRIKFTRSSIQSIYDEKAESESDTSK